MSALPSRSLGVRRHTVNVKQLLGNVTAVKYGAARFTVTSRVRRDAEGKRAIAQVTFLNKASPQHLTEEKGCSEMLMDTTQY